MPYLRDLASRMRCYRPVLGLRATSIGAWLSLIALGDERLELALLQSPLLDMVGLIEQMMRQAGVSRAELARRGEIRTEQGRLSWRYLTYAEANRVTAWDVPTTIIHGERDELLPSQSMEDCAHCLGADLTVVECGAHWLHTPQELDAVAQWEMKALAMIGRA